MEHIFEVQHWPVPAELEMSDYAWCSRPIKAKPALIKETTDVLNTCY